MKKTKMLLLILFLPFCLSMGSAPKNANESNISIDDLCSKSKVYLSDGAKELLGQNNFVAIPSRSDEIYDIYSDAKEANQPIFVTTDSVLHTSHIFFDYILRIIEIEKLYSSANELADRMIAASEKQYKTAIDPEVKEAARLNIGFFGVAKKLFDPDSKFGHGTNDLVLKEIRNIDAHSGIRFRNLLTYVKNPDPMKTPYAYEDYSQYVPRGHYTRNEKFKRYFKAMMWFGRIDFKLRPGQKEIAQNHGRMMTLQAILMADALFKDKEAYKLWKKIYEPTVYFVGKTDDLNIDDYSGLIKKYFPPEGTPDKFADKTKLSTFINEALKLRPPKILSGTAIVEEGEFSQSTKGFRFMGQRFIPDSYMFQELVYGIKNKKEILKYTGSGKPFTMENLPNAGPARAFPRGLDVMAVLGSKKAIDILEREGDTEYTDYYDQLNKLKAEFSNLREDEWKQNLYYRWLYSLLPLLAEQTTDNLQKFMKTSAWADKQLSAALSSWTELRHDTILYAKQSYTMMRATSMPIPQEPVYGYVEPNTEVYKRIKEMMEDLKINLKNLGVASEEISQKMGVFVSLLGALENISKKELDQKELSPEEYYLIENIGDQLSSLKRFSKEILDKITSGTDAKMDIVADVHTDPNTEQVLEEGVGLPADIYVIVEDGKGQRICRGGIFTYYEFKHPMKDRLTDEKWQEMGRGAQKPAKPEWTNSFIINN